MGAKVRGGLCADQGIPGAEVGAAGSWVPLPPSSSLLPGAWITLWDGTLEPSRKPSRMWLREEGPRHRVRVGGPCPHPQRAGMGSRQPCPYHL